MMAQTAAVHRTAITPAAVHRTAITRPSSIGCQTVLPPDSSLRPLGTFLPHFSGFSLQTSELGPGCCATSRELPHKLHGGKATGDRQPDRLLVGPRLHVVHHEHRRPLPVRLRAAAKLQKSCHIWYSPHSTAIASTHSIAYAILLQRRAPELRRVRADGAAPLVQERHVLRPLAALRLRAELPHERELALLYRVGVDVKVA